MLKSRFDEWMAWLTRRLSLNGTTSDMFDYSRIMQGHSTNTTLSFPSFLLALTYMYENTGDQFYLSKLRAFMDGAINNSMNYAQAQNVGEVFFPIAYYFDGVDHDTGSIYPAIFGYIATKLYMLTGSIHYRQVADRIASESYDKLAVVKNDSDVAWSWAYYKNRDLTNAKKGVNRQAFFAWFYALYGKNINSSFTGMVNRVVNWVWRSQLSDGSLSYDIGGSVANPWYTSFATWAVLNAYIIDSTAFSTTLKDKIKSAVNWLNTKYQAQYEYQRLYFLVPALLAALESDYFFDSVSVNRAKSMLYIALRSMHFTNKGFVPRIDGYSFGFRWHQLELAGLFTAYPLSDFSLDLGLLNPVTSYEYATGRYKLNGWAGGVFAGIFGDGKDGYGSGVLHSNGRSLFFGPAGLQDVPTSTSITNNTHYLKVNSVYPSYTVDYYMYPVGVCVGDVVGTTSAEIVLDDNVNWRIRVANGSEWQLSGLTSGSAYDFGNKMLLYLNDSDPTNIRSYYVEGPTSRWRYTFFSSTLRLNFSEAQTDYRIIYAEVESFGHLVDNPGTMFSVLDSLAETHNVTQPVEFETSFSVYHNQITEREPEATWKTLYETTQMSTVKLIGHNLPETTSIESWSYAPHNLTFSISAKPQTESIVEIYVGSVGRPKNVLGASSWSYDNETKTVTINVINSGIETIQVHWPERNPPVTRMLQTGTQGNHNWFISNVKVSLFAEDDFSGVDKTEYSFDNSTWKTYTTPFSLSEGVTAVYYRSIDKDCNTEVAKTTIIKIDTTEPLGSIKINNDAIYTTNSQVALTLTATDELSGIDEMRLSNDNIEFTDWQAFKSSSLWNLISYDGSRTVYVQFRDNAGILSSIIDDVIVLDSTKPKVNAGSDQIVSEDVVVTLDAAGSQDENGIADYVWSFNDLTHVTLKGRKVNYTFVTPSTYLVTLTVMDSAGNQASDWTTITALDTTKPEIVVTSHLSVREDTTVVLDASGSSDNVGIVSFEWDFGDGEIGTGRTATHVYRDPGTYLARLTVKDGGGNAANTSLIIDVLPLTSNPSETVSVEMLEAVLIATFAILAVTVILRRIPKSPKRHSMQR